MTQATIGFVFDGSGVVAAEQGLQRVVSAADRVDQSASRAEGSTEALARSLTATGSAGNATRVVLEQLDKVERQLGLTAGTTGAALDRQAVMLGSYANSAKAAQMAGLNMSRQFADIGVTLAAGAPAYLVLLQQLPQVADGMEVARTQGVGFGAMLRETFGIFGRFLPLLAGFAAAAGAIAAPFAIAAERINAANGSILDDLDLTDEQLQRVGNTSVTMGDVMTGVWRSTARELNQAFGPAFDQFRDIVGDAYVWVIERTVEWARGMVSAAAGVAIGIAFGFRALPRAIAEVMIDVANFARPGLQMLVDVSVEAFNRIRAGMNIIRGLRGEAPIPEISAPELARRVNQFRGAGAELRDAWAEGLGLGRRAGELATDAFGRRLVEDILGARDDRVRRLAGEAGADVGRDYAEGIERGARERAERIRAVQGARPLETTTLVGPELIDELARFREELLRVEETGRNAGYRIADAFGGVGQALDGVLQSMSTFSRAMVEIAMAERDQQISTGQAIRARGILQVQTIGDVAAASKAAFEQDSAAYQVLATLERGYRAVQFALSVQAMVQDAREAAASIINAKAKMAADSSAGAAKIFSQVGIWGFAAVGAMLALLGSLGGGGSSGSVTLPTSNTGTGTVLGAPDEASQSIANSLQRAEEYQNRDLRFSSEMVSSLRAIEDNISVVTTSIARQVGAGGAFDTAGLNLGTTTGGGFLGIGQTTRTRDLVDQGLQLASGSLADLIANGVRGATFQTIQNTKTKSGFLGIGGGTTTWNTETTGAMDALLGRQLGQLLASLRDGIAASAAVIGVEGAEAVLDNFRVQLGRISFNGMSSAEISDALRAVFSAVGDQMAGALVPGLQAFQRAGEGLMETLTRLAVEYQAVDDTLASIGMTFRTVGLESIEARSRLVQLSGGLEEFTSQADFFANEFLTEAQRIAPIQAAVNAELARLGLSSDITREQFAALVMGIDVSTEAGASLYAALMRLAPGMDAVLDYTEQLTGAVWDMAQVERDRRQLEWRIMEMTGEASRALIDRRHVELQAMHESLRPLQERIWSLEDAARAEAEAQRVLDQRRSLEVRLMEATGDTAGVLAARREAEMASMDESLRSLLGLIYAAEDANRAMMDAQRASEEATRAYEQRVNDARSALSQAYQRESSALQGIIDRFGGFGESLRAFRRDLDGTLGGGVTSTAGLRAEFERIGSLARLGDEGALGQLQGAGQAFIDASRQSSVSSAAFRRDVAFVSSIVDQALGTVDRTVINAQRELDLMTAQVDGLLQVNDSVLSVRDAILGLNRLGVRTTAFASGGIFTSPTVFGIGRDMGIMAEAGPEAIVPLVRGPDGLGVSMYGANDNSELKAEIASLSREISELKAAMVQTALNTGKNAREAQKTRDLIERLSDGGDALRTTEAA